jgi:hypothetical protein
VRFGNSSRCSNQEKFVLPLQEKEIKKVKESALICHAILFLFTAGDEINNTPGSIVLK